MRKRTPNVLAMLTVTSIGVLSTRLLRMKVAMGSSAWLETSVSGLRPGMLTQIHPTSGYHLKRGASFATKSGFDLKSRRAADAAGERNFWTGFRIASDTENPKKMVGVKSESGRRQQRQKIMVKAEEGAAPADAAPADADAPAEAAADG